MVADATSGRHGLRKAASRMRGSFENLANAPWLIRRSGGVQNAGEFAVRFLKFDALLCSARTKTRGVATMTIFEGLLLILTVAGMTVVYEWRQDVLYGPYLGPDDQLDVR